MNIGTCKSKRELRIHEFSRTNDPKKGGTEDVKQYPQSPKDHDHRRARAGRSDPCERTKLGGRQNSLLLFRRTPQHRLAELLREPRLQAFGYKNGIAFHIDHDRPFFGVPGVIAAQGSQVF
jgi:hypothetical protein